MIKLKYLLSIVLVLIMLDVSAQILYNNGNEIWLNNSAIVSINGDVINAYGDVLLTNTSSTTSDLYINGNLINNSSIKANGNIHISGNWYNNSDFESSSGSVILTGSSQTLSGTESTIFFNLEAASDGLKTLEIDQTIAGQLEINDAEFNTKTHALEITNIDLDAISTDNGFVSSTEGGFLVRNTLLEGSYFFPVGSHLGDDRLRPIYIVQYSDEESRFHVRFINNDPSIDDLPINSHDTLVEEINQLFYHQILRSEGIEDILLEIEYLESDGEFDAISYWNTRWTTIENSNLSDTHILCYSDSVYFDNKEFVVLSRKTIIEEPPIEPPVTNFIVYNSFSPNGDNYNDTWIIDDIESYPNCIVSIFNRNGNIVFESDGYSVPWNGEYKDEKVPDATYYYIIDLYGDGSDLRRGNITIIR